MSENNSRFKPKHVKWFAGIAVFAALAAAVFWAWHGTIVTVARVVWASAAMKTFLVLLIVTIVSAVVAFNAQDRSFELGSRGSYYDREAREAADAARRRADKVSNRMAAVALVCGFLTVLAPLGLGIWGGYYQGTVLADSSVKTDDSQPTYEWRTPWVVAAQSASSRAGEVTGDFREDSTTFLPATGQYVTPVKARGFVTGLSTVVVQNPGSATADTCSFAAEVPLSGGLFDMNLRRALTFVDRSLLYNRDDVWVYCDGDNAKMVVPVMTMVGQPQSHPVPAGVAVFDGESVEILSSVAPGELPGPVYPSSLAAAQRDALRSSSGLADKLFSRAGYETSEDLDGDPNKGNVAELLLARADGSGWDYVTPLTPRGKSFTVTALSVVPADRVTAGELNELTIHQLPVAREGNQAVADRIKAAFPQLGWAAGLTLVEVIPTSDTTWAATLSNGRAVANRVELNSDGTLCLQDVSGEQLSCVNSSGTAQEPTNATGAAPSETASQLSDLSVLSDEELAQLAVDVANEQLLRTQ